jgi:hypothetical protein
LAKAFHIATLFTPLIDQIHVLKALFSTTSIIVEVELLDDLTCNRHNVFTLDEARQVHVF